MPLTPEETRLFPVRPTEEAPPPIPETPLPGPGPSILIPGPGQYPSDAETMQTPVWQRATQTIAAPLSIGTSIPIALKRIIWDQDYEGAWTAIKEGQGWEQIEGIDPKLALALNIFADPINLIGGIGLFGKLPKVALKGIIQAPDIAKLGKAAHVIEDTVQMSPKALREMAGLAKSHVLSGATKDQALRLAEETIKRNVISDAQRLARGEKQLGYIYHGGVQFTYLPQVPPLGILTKRAIMTPQGWDLIRYSPYDLARTNIDWAGFNQLIDKGIPGFSKALGAVQTRIPPAMFAGTFGAIAGHFGGAPLGLAVAGGIGAIGEVRRAMQRNPTTRAHITDALAYFQKRLPNMNLSIQMLGELPEIKDFFKQMKGLTLYHNGRAFEVSNDLQQYMNKMVNDILGTYSDHPLTRRELHQAILDEFIRQVDAPVGGDTVAQSIYDLNRIARQELAQKIKALQEKANIKSDDIRIHTATTTRLEADLNAVRTQIAELTTSQLSSQRLLRRQQDLQRQVGLYHLAQAEHGQEYQSILDEIERLENQNKDIMDAVDAMDRRILGLGPEVSSEELAAAAAANIPMAPQFKGIEIPEALRGTAAQRLQQQVKSLTDDEVTQYFRRGPGDTLIVNGQEVKIPMIPQLAQAMRRAYMVMAHEDLQGRAPLSAYRNYVPHILGDPLKKYIQNRWPQMLGGNPMDPVNFNTFSDQVNLTIQDIQKITSAAAQGESWELPLVEGGTITIRRLIDAVANARINQLIDFSTNPNRYTMAVAPIAGLTLGQDEEGQWDPRRALQGAALFGVGAVTLRAKRLDPEAMIRVAQPSFTGPISGLPVIKFILGRLGRVDVNYPLTHFENLLQYIEHAVKYHVELGNPVHDLVDSIDGWAKVNAEMLEKMEEPLSERGFAADIYPEGRPITAGSEIPAQIDRINAIREQEYLNAQLENTLRVQQGLEPIRVPPLSRRQYTPGIQIPSGQRQETPEGTRLGFVGEQGVLVRGLERMIGERPIPETSTLSAQAPIDTFREPLPGPGAPIPSVRAPMPAPRTGIAAMPAPLPPTRTGRQMMQETLEKIRFIERTGLTGQLPLPPVWHSFPIEQTQLGQRYGSLGSVPVERTIPSYLHLVDFMNELDTDVRVLIDSYQDPHYILQQTRNFLSKNETYLRSLEPVGSIPIRYQDEVRDADEYVQHIMGMLRKHETPGASQRVSRDYWSNRVIELNQELAKAQSRTQPNVNEIARLERDIQVARRSVTSFHNQYLDVVQRAPEIRRQLEEELTRAQNRLDKAQQESRMAQVEARLPRIGPPVSSADVTASLTRVREQLDAGVPPEKIAPISRIPTGYEIAMDKLSELTRIRERAAQEVVAVRDGRSIRRFELDFEGRALPTGETIDESGALVAQTELEPYRRRGAIQREIVEGGEVVDYLHPEREAQDIGRTVGFIPGTQEIPAQVVPLLRLVTVPGESTNIARAAAAAAGTHGIEASESVHGILEVRGGRGVMGRAAQAAARGEMVRPISRPDNIISTIDNSDSVVIFWPMKMEQHRLIPLTADNELMNAIGYAHSGRWEPPTTPESRWKKSNPYRPVMVMRDLSKGRESESIDILRQFIISAGNGNVAILGVKNANPVVVQRILEGALQGIYKFQPLEREQNLMTRMRQVITRGEPVWYDPEDIIRQQPPQPPARVSEPRTPGEISARENYNRLYTQMMNAYQAGDTQTVNQLTPQFNEARRRLSNVITRHPGQLMGATAGIRVEEDPDNPGKQKISIDPIWTAIGLGAGILATRIALPTIAADYNRAVEQGGNIWVAFRDRYKPMRVGLVQGQWRKLGTYDNPQFLAIPQEGARHILVPDPNARGAIRTLADLFDGTGNVETPALADMADDGTFTIFQKGTLLQQPQQPLNELENLLNELEARPGVTPVSETGIRGIQRGADVQPDELLAEQQVGIQRPIPPEPIQPAAAAAAREVPSVDPTLARLASQFQYDLSAMRDQGGGGSANLIRQAMGLPSRADDPSVPDPSVEEVERFFSPLTTRIPFEVRVSDYDEALAQATRNETMEQYGVIDNVLRINQNQFPVGSTLNGYTIEHDGRILARPGDVLTDAQMRILEDMQMSAAAYPVNPIISESSRFRAIASLLSDERYADEAEAHLASLGHGEEAANLRMRAQEESLALDDISREQIAFDEELPAPEDTRVYRQPHLPGELSEDDIPFGFIPPIAGAAAAAAGAEDEEGRPSLRGALIGAAIGAIMPRRALDDAINLIHHADPTQALRGITELARHEHDVADARTIIQHIQRLFRENETVSRTLGQSALELYDRLATGPNKVSMIAEMTRKLGAVEQYVEPVTPPAAAAAVVPSEPSLVQLGNRQILLNPSVYNKHYADDIYQYLDSERRNVLAGESFSGSYDPAIPRYLSTHRAAITSDLAVGTIGDSHTRNFYTGMSDISRQFEPGGKLVGEKFFVDDPAYLIAVRGLQHSKVVTASEMLTDAVKRWGKVSDDIPDSERGNYEPLSGMNLYAADGTLMPNPALVAPNGTLYQFPKYITAALADAYERYNNPKEIAGYLRMYDQVQGFIKAWTLLPFLPWHARNFVDAVWRGWVAGNENIQNYLDAIALLWSRYKLNKTTSLWEPVHDNEYAGRLRNLRIGSQSGLDTLRQLEKQGILEGFVRSELLSHFKEQEIIRTPAQQAQALAYRVTGQAAAAAAGGTIGYFAVDPRVNDPQRQNESDEAYAARVQETMQRQRVSGTLIGAATGGTLSTRIILKKGTELASVIEDIARTALYIDRIKKGDDAAAAAAYTKQIMIDYSDVSPWEQTIGKRLLPFLHFHLKNIPLQLALKADQPAKYNVPYTLLDYMNSHNTLPNLWSNNQPPNEEYMAKWMTEQMPIRVHVNDDGSARYFLLGNWISDESLSRAFINKGPEGVALTIMDMSTDLLYPVFKAPLEWWLNYDFYRQRAIDNAMVQPLPGDPAYTSRVPTTHGWTPGTEPADFLGLPMKAKVAAMLDEIRLLSTVNRANPGGIFGRRPEAGPQGQITREGEKSPISDEIPFHRVFDPSGRDRAINFVIGRGWHRYDPEQGASYRLAELKERSAVPYKLRSIIEIEDMADDLPLFTEYRGSRHQVASDRAKHFEGRAKYFGYIGNKTAMNAYFQVAQDYAREAQRAR